METYCVSCKKYTASENSHVKWSKKKWINAFMCYLLPKKSTFIKKQELHNFNNISND